ncbi:MAG: HAD-IIIC family phosphatase [Candidatus Rokubacteria bacterium]|nr:HAD-IIIC family phosphatase [Candidatus Rokubacteria bacterium]
MRVAFLSNFTISPLAEEVRNCCHHAGIAVEMYVGKLGQAHQEVLDLQSGLYRFAPQVTVLALHPEFLAPDLWGQLPRLTPGEREARLGELLGEVCTIASEIVRRLGGMVLVHNLPVPAFSPFGVRDFREAPGQKELFHRFNLELAAHLRPVPQAFVLDYDGVAARYGKDRMTDPKMHFLGALEMTPGFLNLLAREHLRYLKPLCGLVRKCIVLDLDNTLWGGVVGEVGVGGLALGPVPPGNAFLAFQQALANLSQQGVLLAINSRNNMADAMEAIREHPHMVLREEQFAGIRINWQDKVSNMRELATELRLGLDSLIFIDDDPAERLAMRLRLPEVLTPEWPSDPARYPRALQELDELESLGMTEEDRGRAAFYHAERERAHLRGEAATLEEYLARLEMRARVADLTASDFPRASQLTLRTNQFNLTGGRYAEADLRRVLGDGSRGLGLWLRDRFGENGLVGLCLLAPRGRAWEILGFWMSCRVLGRGVEQTLLAVALEEARRGGAEAVEGTFVPTAKNAPAAAFYPQQGFEPVEAGGLRFRLPLQRPLPPVPPWVKLEP